MVSNSTDSCPGRPFTHRADRRPFINIDNCKITCLESDAFAVPGAENITQLSMQRNLFERLPDGLLEPLPNLLVLLCRGQSRLITLPENFFIKNPYLGAL